MTHSKKNLFDYLVNLPDITEKARKVVIERYNEDLTACDFAISLRIEQHQSGGIISILLKQGIVKYSGMKYCDYCGKLEKTYRGMR